MRLLTCVCLHARAPPHPLSLHCRWTLGGVYLARYEDSPVGAFDEVRNGVNRDLRGFAAFDEDSR
jgi:hypothetical protein